MHRLSRRTTIVIVTVMAPAAISLAAGAQCPGPPPTVSQILGFQAVPLALINQVDAGSTAERAGLSAGDLIASFNGKAPRDYPDLQAFIHALREEAMLSTAALEVWKLDVASQSYAARTITILVPARVGIRIGFAATLQVVTFDVPEGSAAARAGVRKWDFIDAIDGDKVALMRSFVEIDQRAARAAHSKEGVHLTLARWKPLAVPGVGQAMTYASRQVRLDSPALSNPPR